jgi:hypothetical protein
MVDVVKIKPSAGVVKHGTIIMQPGSIVGFEDPDAAPYFIAAGWAEPSDEEPSIVYTQGEVDVDPTTVFGTNEHPDKGKRVLGGNA